MLDEPIVLEAPRSEWPADFERERTELMRALDVAQALVEHIGSTAVSGLVAKPIIDIMVGSVGEPCPDAWTQALTARGYEAIGEAGIPGRWYFRQRGAPFRNVHVVRVGGAHWVHNLAFRDYLRSSPDACARYGAAKQSAVASGATSLVAYSRTKRAVVEALLAEALSTKATT